MATLATNFATMKIASLVLTLVLAVSVNSVSAQSCFDKYQKAFAERGAEDVVDSTYEDIIISVRHGNNHECYLGKVTVKHGRVLVDNFYVKLEDDSYDNLGPRLKTSQPVEIKNGFSQIILDKSDNLYNVIFIAHIKPKKKGFKKAPDFDLD
jgi:hypothetical protein